MNIQSKSKILLVSPHTDDELFGAGATLLKLKEQGHSIKLVVMSCTDRWLNHLGRNITSEEHWLEFSNCASKLSTEQPLMYDTGNVRLEQTPIYKGISWLDGVINDYKPDVVFIPESGYHQEHKIVHNICISCLRPTFNKKHIKQMLAYEIPTSTWNGLERTFSPNVYSCIDNKLEEKIKVFESCYKLQYTESARVLLGETGIRAHAKYRGFESGYDNAEAFMLIKCLDFGA